MASFIALSPRCPFPVPSSLHPSSGLDALLPGSQVFLCFVLQHCFTGEHPAVTQRKRIWEVKCLGPCISAKVFALLLYLVNGLTGCGNTEWLLSEYQRCYLRVFESCLLWWSLQSIRCMWTPPTSMTTHRIDHKAYVKHNTRLGLYCVIFTF